MDDLATFKKNVIIGKDGCWLWQRYRDKHGYGRCTFRGKQWQAHRAAYTMVVGPIPDGMVLHHHCRNPSCANPLHLEPISAVENTLRNVSPPSCNRRKTACVHDHAFDAVNTYRHAGRRYCRRCNAAAVGRYKTRKGDSR